jgi:simple sugar transport system permease protein
VILRTLAESLVSSTLEYAPALIFGALGCVLSERAGVIDVAAEGKMRVGAFVAAVVALTLPTPWAIPAAMLAGAAFASIHAYLSLKWRADQVVSGMALDLVALAGVTFLLESFFSPMGTPAIHALSRWNLPGLSHVPVLSALSGHSALTYLALVAPFAFHAFLWHTPWGLRIRAAGEKPAAAETVGIAVNRVRWLCVLGGGLLAGLGGAAMSTATLDRFEQHMPSGLGFMALAAMVFGRWTPLGAFGAALFFAAGNALRIGLASSLPGVLDVIPQGFLLALPYLLTLVVLAVQGGRIRAPAALGQPYDAESR